MLEMEMLFKDILKETHTYMKGNLYILTLLLNFIKTLLNLKSVDNILPFILIAILKIVNSSK